MNGEMLKNTGVHHSSSIHVSLQEPSGSLQKVSVNVCKVYGQILTAYRPATPLCTEDLGGAEGTTLQGGPARPSLGSPIDTFFFVLFFFWGG